MLRYKINIAILLFFLVVKSFGQIKNGIYESYYKNGNIASSKSYKDDKLNGPSIVYFSGESKKIRQVENYHNGKLHGESKKIFPNGKIEEYIIYENGNRKIKKEFYSDGSIFSITNYSEGVQHGEYKRYHNNGKILNLILYDNGKKVGVSKQFDDKGQIVQIYFHDDYGNQIKGEEYNKFGLIRRIEHYSPKGGILYEETINYNDNGDIKERIIYQKDSSFHITLNKIFFFDQKGDVLSVNEKIFIPDENGFYSDHNYDFTVYNKLGKIIEKRIERAGKTSFIESYDSNEKMISKKVFKQGQNGELVETKYEYLSGLDTISKVNLYHKMYDNFKKGDYDNAAFFSSEYIKQYPDEVYGYYWSFRSLSVVDSTMELGLSVQDCKKFISIAEEDKVKNKNTLITAYGYLAGYNSIIKKDLAGAARYLDKIIEIDPNNQDAIKNRDIIQKALAATKK